MEGKKTHDYRQRIKYRTALLIGLFSFAVGTTLEALKFTLDVATVPVCALYKSTVYPGTPGYNAPTQ